MNCMHVIESRYGLEIDQIMNEGWWCGEGAGVGPGCGGPAGGRGRGSGELEDSH